MLVLLILIHIYKKKRLVGQCMLQCVLMTHWGMHALCARPNQNMARLDAPETKKQRNREYYSKNSLSDHVLQMVST